MNGKAFALLFTFLIAIGTALSLALSHERPESIGSGQGFIDWNHDTIDDERYFELSEFKPVDGSS